MVHTASCQVLVFVWTMHTEAIQRMLDSLQQSLGVVRPVVGQNICMGQYMVLVKALAGCFLGCVLRGCLPATPASSGRRLGCPGHGPSYTELGQCERQARWGLLRAGAYPLLHSGACQPYLGPATRHAVAVDAESRVGMWLVTRQSDPGTNAHCAQHSAVARLQRRTVLQLPAGVLLLDSTAVAFAW